MRRTIAQFLVLLMLFSNAAWAMDASDSAFFGHSAEQVQIDNLNDDHAPSDQQDLEHSDHCCHGVAHLIGMTSAKLTQFDKVRDVAQLKTVTTLTSYKHLPPTPPPTH